MLGVSGDQGKPMHTGVVYSPIVDRVYLATTMSDGSSSRVDAFDANTLEHLALIDSAHRFDWNGNRPLESGRLRISRDARILLATVKGGVVA